MYKLLCSNLTKSHRSLTNFTGYYRIVAEKYHKTVLSNRKLISDTDLQNKHGIEENPEPLECPEEILDVEPPIDKKPQHTSFLSQHITRVPLIMAAATSATSRFFHSTFVNKKFNNPSIKKTFKSKEAERYYQLAIQQCLDIRSRLVRCEQEAKWAPRPLKTLTPVSKQFEPVEPKKKKKKLKYKKLKTKKEGKNHMMPELDKIASMKTARPDYQFKSNKYKITYPIHTIRYKVGTNGYKLQHKIKQTVAKEKKVKIVYKIPVPGPHPTKKVRYYEISKKKRKPMMPQPIIKKPQKLVLEKSYEENSEQDKQRKKQERAVIRQHPTVRQANTTTKMAIKSRYNRLLKKSGLLYQGPSKKTDEPKDIVKKDVPKKVQPKVVKKFASSTPPSTSKEIREVSVKAPDTRKLLPELQVSEHPIAGAKQVKIETPLKHPKRILSEKAESFDIDAMCIKTNNNSNITTSYGDYVAESNEKVRDFVDAHNKEVKEHQDKHKDRHVDDITSFDSIAEYIKKLKDLRDRTAVDKPSAKKPEASKGVDAVQEVESKKIKDIVKKFEDKTNEAPSKQAQVPSEKTSENKKQHPVTNKFNVKKDVDSFARKAVKVVKDPATGKTQPNEQMVRSQSVTNLPEGKIFVIRSVPVKTVRSETLVKKAKLKPLTPKSSMKQFVKTTRDDSIAKKVRSKSEAPKNKETYQFGFSKFEVPEEKDKVHSNTMNMIMEQYKVQPPPETTVPMAEIKRLNRRKRRERERKLKEEVKMQQRKLDEEQKKAVVTEKDVPKKVAETAVRSKTEEKLEKDLKSETVQATERIVLKDGKKDAGKALDVQKGSGVTADQARKEGESAEKVTSTLLREKGQRSASDEKPTTEVRAKGETLVDSKQNVDKVTKAPPKMEEVSKKNIEKVDHKIEEKENTGKVLEKQRNYSMEPLAERTSPKMNDKSQNSANTTLNEKGQAPKKGVEKAGSKITEQKEQNLRQKYFGIVKHVTSKENFEKSSKDKRSLNDNNMQLKQKVQDAVKSESWKKTKSNTEFWKKSKNMQAPKEVPKKATIRVLPKKQIHKFKYGTKKSKERGQKLKEKHAYSKTNINNFQKNVPQRAATIIPRANEAGMIKDPTKIGVRVKQFKEKRLGNNIGISSKIVRDIKGRYILDTSLTIPTEQLEKKSEMIRDNQRKFQLESNLKHPKGILERIHVTPQKEKQMSRGVVEKVGSTKLEEPENQKNESLEKQTAVIKRKYHLESMLKTPEDQPPKGNLEKASEKKADDKKLDSESNLKDSKIKSETNDSTVLKEKDEEKKEESLEKHANDIQEVKRKYILDTNFKEFVAKIIEEMIPKDKLERALQNSKQILEKESTNSSEEKQVKNLPEKQTPKENLGTISEKKQDIQTKSSAEKSISIEISDKTASVVVEEKVISKKDVAETWDKGPEEKKEEKLKLNTEKNPNVQAAAKDTLEQNLEKVPHKKPLPEKVPEVDEVQSMKTQVKSEGGEVENKMEISGEKIKLEGKPIDTKSPENEKHKKFTKIKEASTKIVRLVKKIDFKKPTNKKENYDKSTGPENRPTIPREQPPKTEEKPKKKPRSKPDIVLPPKGRNDPKMKYTRSGGVSFAKSRNDAVKQVIQKHIKDVSEDLVPKESLTNMTDKQQAKTMKETEIAWNKEDNKTLVNPEKENILGLLDTNKDILKEQDELIRKILEKKPKINMRALALDVMKRNERIRRNRKHKRDGPKLIVKLKYSNPFGKAKSRDKKIKPLHYFLGKSFDLNTTQHPEVNTEKVEETEREVQASNITFKKSPYNFQFVETDRLPSSLFLPKKRKAKIEDEILKLDTDYRNAKYTSKDVLWRSQGDLDLCFDNLKRARIEDDCLKQTNKGKDVQQVEKNFFLKDLQSTNQIRYSNMDDTSFYFPTLIRRKIEDDVQKIESIPKTDTLQKTEYDSDSVEYAPLPVILDQLGKIKQTINQKVEVEEEGSQHKEETPREIVEQTDENPIVEQRELPEGDVNYKMSDRFKSIIKKKHIRSGLKTESDSVDNASLSGIPDQLGKIRQVIAQKVEAYMVGLQPKVETPSKIIKQSNRNRIVEQRELPEGNIKYKMSNRFKSVIKKKHVKSRSKTECNLDSVEKGSLPTILDQLGQMGQAFVRKVETDIEGLQSKAPIGMIKQSNENRIVEQKELPEGDVKYKMSNRFKSVIKRKHVRNRSKTELKKNNLLQNAPKITGTAIGAIPKPKIEQLTSSEKLFRKDDTFDTENVKATIDEGSGTKRDIEKLIDVMKTADAELEKVLKAYEVFKVPQKIIQVKPEDDTKPDSNAEVPEQDKQLTEHDLALVKPGEVVDILYQNSMDSKTFVVTAEEMKHFEKEYKTAMGDSKPPPAKIDNLEERPEKNVLQLQIDKNSIRGKHKPKNLIENILRENEPQPPSRSVIENVNKLVGNRAHKKLSPPISDKNNIKGGHKSSEKSTKTSEKPAKSALDTEIQMYTKKHTRGKTEETKNNDKSNKDTKTHTKLCLDTKRQPKRARVFNKDEKKSSGTGKTGHKIIDKKNSFTSRNKRSLRLDIKRYEHKREVCGKSTESDGIEPRISGGKSPKKNPDGKLFLQSLTIDGKETLGNKIVVARSDDVPGESTTGIDKSEERKERQKKPLEIPGKRTTKLRTVKVGETHVSMSTDLPHDSSTSKTTKKHRAVSNKPKKIQSTNKMGKNIGFSKKPQKLEPTPSQWIVLKPNRKRKHYKDGNKLTSNIGKTKVNAQFSIYRSDLIEMFLQPRKGFSKGEIIERDTRLDKELSAKARKRRRAEINLNKNKSKTATKSSGQKEQKTTMKHSDIKSDPKSVCSVGEHTLPKSDLSNGVQDSPEHPKSDIEITDLVRNTRVNILQTKHMLENLLETLKPATLPQPDTSASSNYLNIAIDDKCDNVKENLKDTEKITNVEQVGDVRYSRSGTLNKNQNLLALLDKKLTKEVGKMLVQEKSVQDIDKEEKSCEGDNKGSEEKASEENLESDNSTKTNFDQKDTKCVPKEICQKRLDPKVIGTEEVSAKVTEERKLNTILDHECKTVKQIVNDENLRLAERNVEGDKDSKRLETESAGIDNSSCALVNVQPRKDKSKLENSKENDKIPNTELVRNEDIKMEKRKIEVDATMTSKSKNNVDQKPTEAKSIVNLKPEIDGKKPEKLNLKDGLQCKEKQENLSLEEKTTAINRKSEKLERTNGKFDNVNEEAVAESIDGKKLEDDHEAYKSTNTELIKNQKTKMDTKKQKPKEAKPVVNLGAESNGQKPEKLNLKDGLQCMKKEENLSLKENSAGFTNDNEKLERKSGKFDNVSEETVAESKNEKKLKDDHKVYKLNKTELIKNQNIRMDTRKLGLEIDKRNSCWRERTKHNLSITNLKPKIDFTFKEIIPDDKLKKKNKDIKGQKAAVNKYFTNTVYKVENKHQSMLTSLINKYDSEKAKQRAVPVNALIKNVDERAKTSNRSTFWKNLSSQRTIELTKPVGNLGNDETKPHSHVELRSFVSLGNVGGKSPKDKFLSKTEPCLKHFDANIPNRKVTTNDKNKYKYTCQKIRQSLLSGNKKNIEIKATKEGSSRVRGSEDEGLLKMSRQSRKDQKNSFKTTEKQNTCQKRKNVEVNTKKQPVVTTLFAPFKLDKTKKRDPSETVPPIEVILDKKNGEAPRDKGDANEDKKECTAQNSNPELCTIFLKNSYDDLRLCYDKFKAEENLRKVYAYYLSNKDYFRKKYLKNIADEFKTLYYNERVQWFVNPQKHNGDLLKESILSQVKRNVLPTMLEIAENADTDHQNETQELNETIDDRISDMTNEKEKKTSEKDGTYETKILVPKNMFKYRDHMDITSFSFIENLMKHLITDRMSYDEVHSERNGPVKAKIEEILKKHNSEDEKLYKFNKNLIKHFQQRYKKEPQAFQKQQMIVVGEALLNPRALEITEVQKLLHEYLMTELIKPCCERRTEFSIFKKHNRWLDVVCCSTDMESLSSEQFKKEHPKRLSKKKGAVYIEKVPRNRYEKKIEEPPKSITRYCERLCLPLKPISQVALKSSVEEMTTLNKYNKEKFQVVPKATANLLDKYKDLKITYMDIKRPVAKPDESFLPMIFRLKNKSDSNALDKIISPETAKRQVLEFRYKLLRKLYKEFNELYEKDVNSNVGKFEKVSKYYKSVTKKMKKEKGEVAVASHLKSIDEVLGPCSKPSFERVSRFYKMMIQNDKKDEGKTEETEGIGGVVNNDMQNSIGTLIQKLSERITEVDKDRNDCIGMEQMLAKRGKRDDGDGEDPEDNEKQS